MAVEQAPKQAPPASPAGAPDQDVAWIEQKLVEDLSTLPYVRSISYELDSDGDWFVVIRHDNDDVGEAIHELVGKTADLEKISGIPYLDTRILRVSDAVRRIPIDLKKIFER